MSNKDDLFIFTDLEDAVSDASASTASPNVVPVDQPLPAAADSVTKPEEDAPVIETVPLAEEDARESGNTDAFAAPEAAPTIVEPTFSGTADALTAARKARSPQPSPTSETTSPAVSDTEETANETDGKSAATTDANDPTEQVHPFMRFLRAVVPHIGDSTFDIVRKCIMLVGILVFIGAATYLIDDLILIPIHNDVLVESLQQMYTPDVEQTLSEDEQNYTYPEGIDPAFKKLYYQNNDIRGWLSYKTTDGTTFSIDYPVVQSTDNDYYLFHDFNRTYNKNGTLFFDYRNDLTTKKSHNRNTVIYGHNMASGQMLAGLNKLLWGVGYARVAPTFTLNTIYNKAEYKVFAVMLLNNNTVDGDPFGYLRTEFNDNVDFAGFLSEITARSLYDYGDVDVRPDDEIVMLSTCTDWDLAHFKDGRTVVVARKVRKDEDPATDVSKITVNEDVLMPYGWYVNQKLEPHPYYTDPLYVVQPLDTLMDYLATSTAPEGQTTTSFTLYQQDGTFGIIPTTATDANGNVITQSTKAVLTTVSVETTPVYYGVGSSFDYANTKVVAIYSDGRKVPLNSRTCAITGFDSSKPGTCSVTLHYGAFQVNFEITVIEGYVAPVITTTSTVTRTTTTTRPSNFIPYDPNAKKTTTTEASVTEETTTTTEMSDVPTTSTTETPAVVSDVTDPV